MGLLSPAELGAIQDVAELGMETPVSVLTYTRIERGDHDDLDTWVEVATTTAMIWDEVSSPRPGVEGGVIGELESYKALLRTEIEIHPGDRLGLEGEMFTVVGANEFDTYQPARILALKRFE